MTSKTITCNNNAHQAYLVRQYVSNPIAGQSISGTVKGQVLADETSANTDGVTAIIIYLVDSTGTYKSTLRALTYPALSGNEFALTETNRYIPVSTSLTTQTASNGDRIVVEFGVYSYKKNTAIAYLVFGDNNATDLPEDQTTVTQNNPWIEFSQDIRFPTQGLIEF